ncbi:hypothetical protein T07_672 [Trichinella nelsoni]|uniref:Uncharacterized protein n=1 Tax=Trichinella nelsoni TaxID=6336 RepID=A0A0V0S9L7_9BILA|nr:hypothetical protein T07_672 [Trichinella nelsoni]
MDYHIYYMQISTRLISIRNYRNLILTDRLTNKDDRQSLAFCLLSVAVSIGWYMHIDRIGVGRENAVDPDRPLDGWSVVD